MNPRTWSSLLLGLVLLAVPAGATDAPPFVPEGLPQQGRLLDSNDQPITGKVDMTFNLYHQATGGTPVWTQEQTVSVDAGYYAIVLGDPADTGVQPITTDELAGPTWIGITIGGNEMQPRLQLGTVPYAQRADLANRIEGGTIDGATITNSSVDATSVSVGGHTVIDSSGNVNATSLSVGGNTVIDSSGNIGGKPLSDYVTNDSLTQNYTTSSDLAGQGYDNLVRNGSFELGQAGAMPTYWDAVGTGNGTRAQVADPLYGASALEINDTDSTAQVAARQVVIASSDITGYIGQTFTASVWAKKKSGASGSTGELCLVEADGGGAGAMDCAPLTTDATYARTTVSHVVSPSATYLAVLLDSGTTPGDANDYVFDGVMATPGKLAPAFSPNIAEQVTGELPDASIPDSALPPDVALLDAPSDVFTGDLTAKSFTGSGSGLTGVPDGALSNNIPRLDAASNTFTGSLHANGLADTSTDFVIAAPGSGRGAGGRALVEDGGDTLVVNYAGDFTGGTHVESALKVDGALTASGGATIAGALSAASFTGSGSGLSSLNASNLASGTVPSARLSGSYTGITGVGTLTAGTWNAGTIPVAHGGTGTTTSTGTGNVVLSSSPSLTAPNIGAATASSITDTGALSAASFTGSGAGLTNLNASNLATGIVPSARLSGSYPDITGVGTLTAGTWNAGTIAVAHGGTGTTTSTGTGNVVLSSSPSLTTPNIGAATASSITDTGALSAAGGKFAVDGSGDVAGAKFTGDGSGLTGVAAASLPSLGNDLNAEVNRETKGNGVYTYSTYSTGTGGPSTYDQILTWGNGGSEIQISGDWISTTDTPLYVRSLRDCCQNWSAWTRILTTGTDSYPSSMNQNVRTTDSPTFAGLTVSGALSAGSTTLGALTASSISDSGALSAGTTTLGGLTASSVNDTGTLRAGTTTLGALTASSISDSGALSAGTTTVGALTASSVTDNGALTVNGNETLNGAYTPGYATYGSVGAGGAAITNDNNAYKTLMILGNNSGGGVRQVGIWDNLTVNGTATVNGFQEKGTDLVIGPASGRGNGGRALVLDGSDTLTVNYGGDFTGGTHVESNLAVDGVITGGCLSGWWNINGGRICMSGMLYNNFYAAMDTCKTLPTAGSGLYAHVCTYAETETACAAGYSPYTQSSGWYGDLGQADDYFQTWNSASCASNNTGSPTLSSNNMYYRCCY